MATLMFSHDVMARRWTRVFGRVSSVEVSVHSAKMAGRKQAKKTMRSLEGGDWCTERNW